jgi:hypothetical protein
VNRSGRNIDEVAEACEMPRALIGYALTFEAENDG